MKTIFTLLLTVVICVSFGQPGTLDSTFGNNGSVTLQFANADTLNRNSFRKIIYLDNGKILAAGYNAHVNKNGAFNDADFMVCQFLVNGNLDSSFGKNGIVTTDLGKDDHIADMKVQPDHKILVCGYSATPGSDMAVVRYLSTGNLDSSFGNNGVVITDISYDDNAKSILLLNNGKFILAGNTVKNRSNKFLLVKYDAKGKIDSSFGNNGKTISDFSGVATCAQLQSDNKIVVAGQHENRQYYDFLVARFLPNGTIDSSFGKNGISVNSFLNSIARACIIQPDGKIILGGSSGPFDDWWSGELYYCIARYTKDGKLDSSFGNFGSVILIKDYQSYINDLVLQDNGKIIGAGGDTYFLPVIRFSSSGWLNENFGEAGVSKIPGDGSLYSITLQPDRKILVCGFNSLETGHSSAFIARLNNGPVKQENKKSEVYTSVKNNAEIKTSVSIYPNPVKDMLNINGLDRIINYELRIINAKGDIVKSGQEFESNQTGCINLNVQTLSKGVYYLSILSNQNKKTTVKFVKE